MPEKMKAGFVAGFLIASVLFVGWTGYISMTAPDRFAQPLGYVLIGLDGRNELRAQYGGLFFAVAAGILALIGRIPRRAALLVNSVLFGGLIAGRLISLALDGGMNGYGTIIRTLFLIDSTGSLLSIAALSIDRFKSKPG